MKQSLKMVGLACAVIVCAAPLGGCRLFGLGFGSSSSAGGGSDPYYSESDLVVENGLQEGEMGYIEGYSATTFLEQGYTSDNYTHVRLESEGDGWWVMSLINISGVPLDSLEPGVVYATATSGILEEGEPDISVTGCSGPSQGNYTYDTQASRTEMEVEDLGDGVRRVHFRTWYVFEGSGEQLTQGSFDYRTTG